VQATPASSDPDCAVRGGASLGQMLTWKAIWCHQYVGDPH